MFCSLLLFRPLFRLRRLLGDSGPLPALRRHCASFSDGGGGGGGKFGESNGEEGEDGTLDGRWRRYREPRSGAGICKVGFVTQPVPSSIGALLTVESPNESHLIQLLIRAAPGGGVDAETRSAALLSERTTQAVADHQPVLLVPRREGRPAGWLVGT